MTQNWLNSKFLFTLEKFVFNFWLCGPVFTTSTQSGSSPSLLDAQALAQFRLARQKTSRKQQILNLPWIQLVRFLRMLDRQSLLFSPTREAIPSSDDNFTANDIISAQEALENEARDTLPFDPNSCSHELGYLRQPIYACKTCPLSSSGGFCGACSVSCGHSGHDLVELFHRRNFRCDCGTGLGSCSIDKRQGAPKNDQNTVSFLRPPQIGKQRSSCTRDHHSSCSASFRRDEERNTDSESIVRFLLSRYLLCLLSPLRSSYRRGGDVSNPSYSHGIQN